MNQRSILQAHRVALSALLLLAAACTVSESGNIPCKDNTNCPPDYATCGTAGFCVPGTTLAKIEVVSGGEQSAVAGSALAAPLTVLASDTNGNPFEGADVTWAVASGGGSVSAASNKTGPDGKATVVATTGTLVGPNSFTAKGTVGSALAFAAVGTPGAAIKLTLTGTSSLVAGSAQSYTLTALDANNNVATGYTGHVTFASTDAAATLPAPYDFKASDAGVHVFTITFRTSGSFNLSATDGPLSVAKSAVAVSAGVASQLTLGFVSSTVAGVSQEVTVTAKDNQGNVAVGYTGKVTFTSSDAAGVLPAAYTFVASDAGVHRFNVTLKTAGSHTLTGADGTLTASKSGIAVSPASAATIILTGPTTAVAAIAQTYTVTAFDAFQNIATGYLGRVTFTSNDANAALPAAYTFLPADLGVARFQVAFGTAATESLTIGDGALPSNTLASIVVSPGNATSLQLTGPSSAVAGVAGTYVLTALDTKGNVSTQYRGQVSFSVLNDNNAVLPTQYTFTAGDAGIKSFSVTLKAAITTTLSATDGTLTGSRPGIVVGSAAAVSLKVAGFANPATAGTASSFTVTAFDPFGNVSVGYRGAVHFTTDNLSSTLPADYTFVAADNGSKIFSGTLKKSSAVLTFFLTATDKATASIAGTQAAIFVIPGTAATLTVAGFANPATSGGASSVTVTALDANANIAAGYTGTVHFTTDNAGSTLPADFTFTAGDAGTHTFTGAILKTAGPSFSITATDTVTSSITGVQAGILVGPATAASFTVTTFPTSVVAGVAGSVLLTALDGNGNVATGYRGTVKFTSSNGNAVLPADYNFTNGDNGTHNFNNGVTLKTASVGGATFSITATDSIVQSITGSEVGITVTPAAAAKLAYNVQPTDAVATVAISPAVVVAVQDAFGNLVTSSSLAIAVAINNNAGIGTLSGSASTNASGGLATFSNLSINKTGVGYTLNATSSGLTSATSSAFTITPGPATKLAFNVQPSNVSAGAPITPGVVVLVQDASSNTVTTSTASISIALGNNPTGATLGGTFPVNAVAGVATFADLTLDKAGTAFTLSASSTGLTSATSTAFNATSGGPVKLVITAQPSNTVSLVAISPSVVAQVQDFFGNVVVTSTASVTMSIGTNAGGGALTGTVTVNAVAGVATFSNLKIDKVGTGYTLTAASSALTSSTSSAFNITPGAAAKLAFSVQPTTAISTAAISPAVQVAIQDASGNTVTSSTANVSLVMGNNAGSGTLTGGGAVAAVAGIATFSSLSIDKVGTGYTLTGNSGALTSATSSAFNITPGAAAKLAVSVQPSNTASGVAISPAVVIQVLDASSNLVTSSTASVAMAINNNPSAASLTGTPTVSAVAGVATFSNLILDKVGTGYTLTASSSGLTSVTTGPFNITPGTATKLVYSVQPSTAVSLVAISPAVLVQVQDAAGNVVTSSTASVTMSIGTNAGGGSLSGTPTVSAVAGVATFSNLRLDKVGTGYTLTAASSGLASATSSAFNITFAAAAKLAFSVQPTDAVSLTSISPAVLVQVEDASGNLVSSSTASIAMAIGSNVGGGTLSGGASVSAVGGVATFSGLNIDKSGTGYTLAATSGGLTGATSAAFNITFGAAAKLGITAQPGNASAGAPISMTVAVQDASGNTVMSSSASVTVAIQNNPSSGLLTGSFNLPATAGLVAFTTLAIDKVGSPYTLVASSTGLTSVISAGFAISAAAATKLVFAIQPTNAAAGASISPAVVVQVQDASGNVVTSSTAAIAMALGTNLGGSTLAGTTPVNAVAGVATFSNLSLNKVAAGYTLVASTSGLTSATSTGFNITPGTATKVVIFTQPVSAVSTVTLAGVVAQIQDAAGNVVTGSSANVVIAFGNNAGSGTLSGTLTVPASSGVATFSTLSIDKAGTGYTLVATSAGLTSATSNAFNITAGAASKVAFAQGPSNAQSAASISPAITVQVQDASGNLVSSSTASVTIAIGNNAGPGGLLAGSATANASAGVATFSNLSIDKVGTGYTLTAASSGLTGATSGAFNITPAAASKLVFSVQPTSALAGSSISPAVVVQVQDAAGNVVTSSVAAIAMAIGTNPGTSVLSGTTPVNAIAGVATFSNLSLNKVGTGYTLVATSAGLTLATSSTFDITPGAANKVVFTVQPVNTASTASITPAVVVQVQDSSGNVVTSSSASVSMAIATNAGGGTLTGSAPVTASSGVATFSTLSIDKTGTGYTLSATSAGLISATSAAFNITPGAASKLVVTTQPSNTVSGANITPAVVVQVQDASSNVVTTSTATVVMAISNNAGSGALSGTPSVNAVAGVATFSALNIDKVGTGYTLIATSAGLASATTGTFNITVGVANKLAYSVQPGNTVSAVVIAPSVVVQILDSGGNLTTSTANVTVAFGANPGGGTLGGTKVVAGVTGSASFSTLTVDKTGNGYTLTATSPGLTSVTSATFNITPAAATKVVFNVQPTNAASTAAITPSVAVQVQDAQSNVVTGSSASVTLAIGTNAGGGTLSGTATVAASAGVATFPGMSIDKAGSGYTLTAASSGLTGATSNTFNITPGAANKLAFGGQPSNALSTVAVAPAITVLVQDASGNTVTTSSANILMAIGTNAGSGSLAGTSTIAASSGVATFSNLSIDKVGTGYTLSATSAGLTLATSNPFNINLGAAAKLTFSQQPANVVAGAVVGGGTPVTVRVEDAGGNLVSTTNNVTLASVPSVSVTGAVAAAVGGVATFSSLTLTQVGTYTLVATANVGGAITSAPTNSNSFVVSADVPSALTFVAQPVNVATSTPMGSAVTLQLVDQFGNSSPTAGATVSLATTGTCGGAIVTTNGTSTSAGTGLATFTGVTLDLASTACRLSASSTTPTLASTANSSAFAVVGSAAKVVFTTPPADPTARNTNFSVVVQVQDTVGNLISGSTASITLTLPAGQGGSLGGSGAKTKSAVAGVASYTNLQVSATGGQTGSYTLRATASGLATDDAVFNVN